MTAGVVERGNRWSLLSVSLSIEGQQGPTSQVTKSGAIARAVNDSLQNAGLRSHLGTLDKREVRAASYRRMARLHRSLGNVDLPHSSSREINMRTLNVIGLLLIAAFAIGCSEQTTQPSANPSRLKPSRVGHWGVVPSGAATTARVRPKSGVAAAAASVGQFANGSFETGDYSGWTLFEGGLSTEPFFSTWGIARNGQTINPGQLVFDFFDGIDVPQFSPGLPHTYTATNGNFTALQLQNGPQSFRMFQDIALPAGATTISWDMEYNNHNGDFVPDAQELEVNVRDVSSDAILATLLRTTRFVDPFEIPVTHFIRNVSAFGGRTVRISVDMIVDRLFFDAAFDNFKVDFRVARAKNDCKNGGWKLVFRADGTPFKNQGDCIQYVNTGK